MPQSGLRPQRPGAAASLFQSKHVVNAAKILILCGLTALAAGCVETTAERQPQPQLPQRTNMARRDGVSPHGASVAIDIQSASPAVAERLWHVLEAEAQGHDLNVADSKAANYFARGFLSSAPAEGGATFSVVWDIYEAKKLGTRIQRVDDRAFVKGATGNLETIDEATLSEIAGKSADDLAAVLSNMPEAIAAASSPSAKAFVARAPDGGTTSVPGTPPAKAASVPKEPAPGVAAAR
jgi:hypothetical protein